MGSDISDPGGEGRADAAPAGAERVDVVIDLRSQPRPAAAGDELVIRPLPLAQAQSLRVVDEDQDEPSHHWKPPRPSPRLKATEPLGAALKRMILELLDLALAHLDHLETDPDTSVHEIRKAFKRVRGLIRLVRDEVGYDVYHPENVVLRDLGRKLAPVRDAAVMLGTIDDLRKRYAPALADDPLPTLTGRLQALHRAEVRSLLEDEHRRTAVSVTLRSARARYAAWPVEDGSAHGVLVSGAPVRDSFAAIEPGMRRVYRRGRRAWKASARTRSAADMHQWRKRAKYLRYQLEALSPLWKEVIGGAARSVDRLGELLGEEHDQAVLIEMAHDPRVCPDELERYLVIALAQERRRRLQAAAMPLGGLIYAELPRVFTGRLGEYWTAARA